MKLGSLWILVFFMVSFIAFGISAQETSENTAIVLQAAADAPAAPAAEETVSVEMFTVNNVWMMVATFLVFIMHLGFSCLESGLTRAKNTVNILSKNVCIVAIGLLTYWLIGWSIMYPGTSWISEGYLAFNGFGLNFDSTAETIAYADGAYTAWTDFLFQGMFAATAATIISGAVAERVKLAPFLIFSAIYVAIIYPIIGSWTWGGGFLANMAAEGYETGFKDFAGSSIVHGVGGWGALVCAAILGPRIGKYVDGKSRPIFGHNIPLANIGMFLLWLGWFGFNGGSVLSAAAGDTSRVLTTTSLAAAAGIAGAMLVSWIVQKKPDLTMLLNGSLAGLVGITASADIMTASSAVLIGLIAGILVVFSVIFIDQKLKIDDPVGAISVHLVCGIWGTIAVAIFPLIEGSGTFSMMTQLKGILAIGATCAVGAGVLFMILKHTIGIRVSAEEEIIGLDISEHSMEAYGGFQIFNQQ
jgi:Amt family ammonium transporter